MTCPASAAAGSGSLGVGGEERARKEGEGEGEEREEKRDEEEVVVVAVDVGVGVIERRAAIAIPGFDRVAFASVRGVAELELALNDDRERIVESLKIQREEKQGNER